MGFSPLQINQSLSSWDLEGLNTLTRNEPDMHTVYVLCSLYMYMSLHKMLASWRHPPCWGPTASHKAHLRQVSVRRPSFLWSLNREYFVNIEKTRGLKGEWAMDCDKFPISLHFIMFFVWMWTSIPFFELTIGMDISVRWSKYFTTDSKSISKQYIYIFHPCDTLYREKGLDQLVKWN